MIGTTILHYRIIDEVGRGGMGVVYKAEDVKLKRIVALKFLPPHQASAEPEKVRFQQEAQAAATLNHPNICTIHAIEDYDLPGGARQQFIDMEFIDGVTLRQRLPIRNLTDFITYAIQIGQALQEAHSKGIVHRDVKAENIMITSRDQIKVMDFGLAKLKGSIKLTHTSSTVGTLAYMAPEQLQGGEVDARSDIFSFGVVLFEMLTGALPFRGEHEAAIMYSIANEQPESLLKLRPDLPPDLERIINRALEKDPEDRYQHADDVVSELRRIKKQTSTVSRVSPSEVKAAGYSGEPENHKPRGSMGSRLSRRFIIYGGIVALVVLAAIAYFALLVPHKSIDSLAVLPFVNAAGDPNTDYLSDGITESLINGLSRLSNLTVMSRSSVFHYKGKEVDPQKAGKELGVKAVLTGRVMQRGDDLIISTELVDVSNNSHIWGDQYNRKLSDILRVQEEISKEISSNLSIKLGGEEEKKLTKRSTENTEAYQLYLKGRFYWNKRKADDLRRALEYFNQAIEQDPNYALAYAGLASTYVLLPQYASAATTDAMPKAEAAATKASALDPDLAEPHAVLGLMKEQFQWDWGGAESEFQRAIELDPNYPTTLHWYSICLRMQGKLEESMEEIKKAQALDPLSLIINMNVGDVLTLLKRYDEAAGQFKKTLELDPNFIEAHRGFGLLYLAQENLDGAMGEFQRIRDIVGKDDPYGLEDVGYIFAKEGKKSEANQVLNQLFESSGHGRELSVQIAMVYTGLGDKDKAFAWLEKGYENKNQWLGYFKISPEWEDLRSDPRYHTLLKKIRLE